MKQIRLKDYKRSMGILINLEEQSNYLKEAKHISYELLMMDYRELLDKNKAYYFYCEKGRKSRKATSILELYGYNVTQVIQE